MVGDDSLYCLAKCPLMGCDCTGVFLLCWDNDGAGMWLSGIMGYESIGVTLAASMLSFAPTGGSAGESVGASAAMASVWGAI